MLTGFSWLFKRCIIMLKDIIISILFFSGVLLSLMLGYGMGANLDNTNVVSLLIASGILFGGVFVVFYKSIKGEL